MNQEHEARQSVQRLRISFSKDGPAQYISHLDLARTLERALNRAGLPVAYTQGFNRRPRLSFAAALPLGYTSRGELADVWLVEPLAPDVFRDRLSAAMAPGIGIYHAVEVPLQSPSLQQQVAESLYEVQFLEPVDGEELKRAVTQLLAAESFKWEKVKRKSKARQIIDLRPLIVSMLVDTIAGGAVILKLGLRQTPDQTGRPDDILAALGIDPLDARVCRLALRLVAD